MVPFIELHSLMHGDTHCPEVRNTQDTADHIPAEVIKDQNLPNRIAIGVQYRCDWRQQGMSLGFIFVAGLDGFVQVEDLLERR